MQEPCLGGELFDYIIDHKHVTESLARRTASVLLSIVQHCHSRGVLHRDLKPENFLLKWPVQPDKQFDPTSLRAVDFGLSVFFGPEGCDEVVGSPSYTAPEMLKGLSYGPPADLWSLGVVLFILVGGWVDPVTLALWSVLCLCEFLHPGMRAGTPPSTARTTRPSIGASSMRSQTWTICPGTTDQ